MAYLKRSRRWCSQAASVQRGVWETTPCDEDRPVNDARLSSYKQCRLVFLLLVFHLAHWAQSLVRIAAASECPEGATLIHRETVPFPRGRCNSDTLGCKFVASSHRAFAAVAGSVARGDSSQAPTPWLATRLSIWKTSVQRGSVHVASGIVRHRRQAVSSHGKHKSVQDVALFAFEGARGARATGTTARIWGASLCRVSFHGAARPRRWWRCPHARRGGEGGGVAMGAWGDAMRATRDRRTQVACGRAQGGMPLITAARDAPSPARQPASTCPHCPSRE